jgi:hypothetical protein
MARKAKKVSATENSGLTEFIERFKARPFLFTGTILVLVIVIIAFVFVPAGPSARRGRGMGDDGGLVFGYYNGKPISLVYNNYFDRTLREIAGSSGFDLQSNYSRNSGAAYQVWYAAFIRSLVRTAILEEMALSGYTAPPKEIDKLVAGFSDFQEDGRFSIVKYNNYDKNKLLTLWNNVETGFTAQKYADDLYTMKISSAEKNFIANMAQKERNFDMVSFPRSAYPDSEVSSYAQANTNHFKMIHISRITLGSEKQAKQVLASIENGKTTFEDAVRNHSTDKDKDKDGDLGQRMAYELYTEIAEEADRAHLISLTKGDLSPVIKAPNGSFIFFRVEETPYDADLSTADNLAKVRAYMSRFEGGRMENWLVARAGELLAQAKQRNISLSAYIESLKEKGGDDSLSALIAGITTNDIGPFNLNYGNLGGGQMEYNLRLFPNTLPDTGPSMPGLPEDPKQTVLRDAAVNEHFWKTAFSLPLNEPSAPFTLGETLVVLTPTAETLPDDVSLQNISSFYAMGWMSNITETALNGAILKSGKLENNFFEVFRPMLADTSATAEE